MKSRGVFCISSRKEKGVSTNYTLNGKNIVHMTQGSNDLHFFYDAQGKPAMVRFNGTDYFYVYNLQGDVVAVIDANGTQVVECHYDAWGVPVTKTGTMAATLGTLNPFRYRGYVYDEETGLYYLRSRYYNPAWKRFVSPDSILVKASGLPMNNLYQYCWNKPVAYADDTGTWAIPSIQTVAYGISWDVSIGVYTMSHSVGVAYDTAGDVALIHSVVGVPPDIGVDDIPAGGLMGAGAFVSAFYQVFPNVRVEALSAEGSNFGASFGPFSIDGVTLGKHYPDSDEISGIQLSIGKSLAGCEWVHFGNSYTKIKKIIEKNSWTPEAEQFFKDVKKGIANILDVYTNNLKKMLGIR